MQLTVRVAVAVASLILVTTAPVAAGSPPPPVEGFTGRPGVHSLVESADAPAGRCRYGYQVEGEGYYNGVRLIRVIAPVAFARAGRVSQRITSRLTIEYWTAGDGWLTYASTRRQARTATPTEGAPFTARTVVIDSRPLHGLAGAWRGRLDLRWYARDGATVTGTARLYPDLYDSWEGSDHLPVQAEFCGGTTG